MRKQYRIVRNLPNHTEVQMRSGTEAEAADVLISIKRRWEEVAEMGTFNGGPPYTTKLENATLTVYHGDKVIDSYVREEIK